ncbi:MAG: ABC transporter substrate-binding protein [Acetivibrionales bacterium]|jgi:branched-chain amino acid transport system substrate-binding protein
MKKLQRLRLVSLCIMLIVIMVFTGCGATPTTPTSSTEHGSADSPAASKAPENKEPFHIAVIGPMTGDNAQYGTQFVRGVETFIEEYNSAGGLDGRMFKMDVYDDKNDAKEAVNIANLIVSKDMYTAIIGPYASTNAFAMGDILDEAKMINISPCSSHPDYTKVLDYTIRIGHVNNKEGEFVAKYLKQKIKADTIAGIYINNDWGVAVNEAFSQYVDDMGMKLVVNESYVAGQTKDFSPILSKIKESNDLGVKSSKLYTVCTLKT